MHIIPSLIEHQAVGYFIGFLKNDVIYPRSHDGDGYFSDIAVTRTVSRAGRKTGCVALLTAQLYCLP